MIFKIVKYITQTLYKKLLLLGFLFLYKINFISSQNINDSLALTRNRNLLVVPAITHSIETDWSFGAAASYTFRYSHEDTLTRTSNLQTLALYSLNKQFVVALDGTIFFPHEKYILGLHGSFSYFPDKFWGLGNDTPDSNEESYIYKQFYIFPHLQRSFFHHNFFIGAMYEFQKVFGIKYGMDKPNISESLFEKENITGRNGSIVSGFGVSFTWDSRNEAFSPNKGSFAQLKYIDFNKLFGSEYSYWNIVFDARRYIAVNTKHVLALQAFAFFNEGTVPIRSMALLGGNNNMRGYYDGRFRDKNQVVFQAEYRLPLFWRFGATGFGGLGEVSDRIGTLNTLHYTYGAGLRFALKPKEKLNIRVDYGFGEGGSNGLYFMIGEAF